MPKDQPLDADILIHIGPVDTDAVANQLRTANGSMTANSAASACCAKVTSHRICKFSQNSGDVPTYFASHPAKDTPPSRGPLTEDPPLDADILTQIGSVDADAVANQSPVGAFVLRARTRPRVPGQR